MGKDTFSQDAFAGVKDSATAGGTASATHAAEEQVRRGGGMDPLVDPKGLAHLGPIRRSMPRFEKRGKFWVLTRGIPMAEETLLDTTGSMHDNVDLAFHALPLSYQMLTTGPVPILGRYDVQIATGIFNDVEDKEYKGIPVLCRSQFEMAEKIAQQMTKLVPGRDGRGNGKEDPQFGLFGAAYLTAAGITKYGLKSYHFTISDEPLVETVDLKWLKEIYGDDVLERVSENGHTFGPRSMPDTMRVVGDLQRISHAFFLMVCGHSDQERAARQWKEYYGADHVVMLPDGTRHLHAVKAVIIGLTEGVLGLNSAQDFLCEHEVSASVAKKIVRAVAHIPIGAQALLPNFGKLPKAGDVFRDKLDLWPMSQKEVQAENGAEAPKDKKKDKGPDWL